MANVENSHYVYVKGTKFRNDQIASRSPIDGKPSYNTELVVNSENKVEKRYVVELVDGTVVSLPEQKQENNASVIMANDGIVHYDNIQGGTVFDTPKDDKYIFTKCKSIKVNAKREESRMFCDTTQSNSFWSPSTYRASIDKDRIGLMLCSGMEIGYSQGYDILNINGNIFKR